MKERTITMDVIIMQDAISTSNEVSKNHDGHIIFNRFDLISIGFILGCVCCLGLIGYLGIKWVKKRRILQEAKLQPKDK